MSVATRCEPGSPRTRWRRRASRRCDQGDRGEHAREALLELGGGRGAEGDARVADLAARPGESLRDRLVADEERARDRRRVEPGDEPERQRDLRVRRERRGGSTCRSARGARRGTPPPRNRGWARAVASRRSSRPRARRRAWSIARRRAVVVIQPPGFAGRPSRGQRSSAIAKASWTASSAASTSPNARTNVAIARACSSRKTRSTASGPGADGSDPLLTRQASCGS